MTVPEESPFTGQTAPVLPLPIPLPALRTGMESVDFDSPMDRLTSASTADSFMVSPEQPSRAASSLGNHSSHYSPVIPRMSYGGGGGSFSSYPRRRRRKDPVAFK